MATKPQQHILDFFEDKARSGDGAFAIAYALLELSEGQKATARAIDKLGFNDGSHTGPPGTTEMLAIQLKRIADSMVVDQSD